jgi:type I restriction enzyme S subunit
MTSLAELPVPICSYAEQKVIVSELEASLSVIDRLKDSIHATLQKTEKLRQSILKRAFEGRLVPQDPNDEPASKLLERIKIEHEREEQMPHRGSQHRRVFV